VTSNEGFVNISGKQWRWEEEAERRLVAFFQEKGSE